MRTMVALGIRLQGWHKNPIIVCWMQFLLKSTRGGFFWRSAQILFSGIGIVCSPLIFLLPLHYFHSSQKTVGWKARLFLWVHTLCVCFSFDQQQLLTFPASWPLTAPVFGHLFSPRVFYNNSTSLCSLCWAGGALHTQTHHDAAGHLILTEVILFVNLKCILFMLRLSSSAFDIWRWNNLNEL